MGRWGIGSAQYSGIVPMGGNRYAVVSDKPKDGFFIFRIDQHPATGEVTSVYLEAFKGNPSPHVNAAGISLRDCEGVAYVPSTNTVFISGEGDQQILEYSIDGICPQVVNSTYRPFLQLETLYTTTASRRSYL